MQPCRSRSPGAGGRAHLAAATTNLNTHIQDMLAVLGAEDQEGREQAWWRAIDGRARSRGNPHGFPWGCSSPWPSSDVAWFSAPARQVNSAAGGVPLSARSAVCRDTATPIPANTYWGS